mmetsp:Transcript_106703/g.244315  ORF Transcript_106703/g.244315 Transcript_106703/m.244315 type:complete len:313 (+) Transcript_106703:1692-2630(+)
MSPFGGSHGIQAKSQPTSALGSRKWRAYTKNGFGAAPAEIGGKVVVVCPALFELLQQICSKVVRPPNLEIPEVAHARRRMSIGVPRSPDAHPARLGGDPSSTGGSGDEPVHGGGSPSGRRRSLAAVFGRTLSNGLEHGMQRTYTSMLRGLGRSERGDAEAERELYKKLLPESGPGAREAVLAAYAAAEAVAEAGGGPIDAEDINLCHDRLEEQLENILKQHGQRLQDMKQLAKLHRDRSNSKFASGSSRTLASRGSQASSDRKRNPRASILGGGGRPSILGAGPGRPSILGAGGGRRVSAFVMGDPGTKGVG